MMKSLGIDLSIARAGVVLLEETGARTPKLLLEHEINCTKGQEGIGRARQIVLGLMETIHAHKPDKIVVEGYSLNMKNASSVIPLVELGGLFRFMMHIDGLKWFDPRATELKKFVTGKGNAPKDVVMMNVLKRWGHESMTNNTADAYALACMGLAQANRLPGITLEMRKIAGAMAAVSR
jgi:crossover junction endodeoxyribonuclease RuvC